MTLNYLIFLILKTIGLMPVLMPLMSFLIAGLFGNKLKKSWAIYVSIFLTVLSLLSLTLIFLDLHYHNYNVPGYKVMIPFMTLFFNKYLNFNIGLHHTKDSSILCLLIAFLTFTLQILVLMKVTNENYTSKLVMYLSLCLFLLIFSLTITHYSLALFFIFLFFIFSHIGMKDLWKYYYRIKS